ncbi:MAG: hypothetical protein K9N48_04090 [Verrucomicrobia bacterium]|nr:hypothetical protein [Verrucomicrobiota bacterium]MCF7709513.1 hypothetical protein [Verrucomicrobiota bacterium]
MKKNRNQTYMYKVVVSGIIIGYLISIPMVSRAACWNISEVEYRQPTECGCDSTFAGSGSCYSSKLFNPENVAEQHCETTDEGYYECDNGEQTLVGREWDCGDQGYDTGSLVTCAGLVLGMGALAIAAIVATGGWAAVAALIAEAGTGATAIPSCAWCSVHICGPDPDDPGQKVYGYTDPVVNNSGCTY